MTRILVALLVLCRVASAQVSPVVVSDFPLTGKGSTSSHLKLTTTCASGQTIQWNGTAWECAANGSASGVSLGIVALGDSHTNGKLPVAPISGAETLGAFGLTNTRDEQWNGTGVGSPFIANSQINSTSGSTDPNLGFNTTSGSYLSWILTLLRSSYPALNKIRVANLGVGGSSAYSWAGENANGYVAGLLAPLDGDTVTIAGVVYTFRTAPAVANDVLIGTATGSILNLCNAVDAEGTGWGAGTVVNPNAFCPNPTATTYGHFFAITPGTGGNSLTISSSNLIRITAATGSLVPASPVNMTQGSNTSSLYANGIRALAGGAGFGQVDIVLVTLGTNDAFRPGDHGRNFQTSMATLIANLRTDFPNAKIMLWKPIVSSVAATNTALTSTIIPAVTALVAADPTHVFFVDMNVLGAGSGDTLILSTDGVHATYYGYQLLAQLFAKKIASQLSLQAGGTTWAGIAAGTNDTIAKFVIDGAHVGDSLLTDNATTLAYGTNKFTVASSSGNGLFAGTLTADGGLRVVDAVTNVANIVKVANAIDLATKGPGAGSCTNCSLTTDAYGQVTARSSGSAPVTAVNVTAPITSTGGTTPTIGISEGNGITNSGGAIVVNNGTGLTFATGALTYDSAVIQSRVSGTCTGPNAITSIAVGGTVTCSTGVLNTGNVSGTIGTSARFTNTNTVGNGAFTDDGTNATLGGTLTVNGTDVTAKRLTVNATATIASITANNTASSASYDPQALTTTVTGTLNTTSSARNAYGNFVTVSTTRTSTNNPAINYGQIIFSSGATTNYSLYGASGQFYNAQAGEFGASLLVDTTLHGVGAVTLDSTLNVAGLAKFGAGTDTSAIGSNPVMITNAGNTVAAVRDSTNDIEADIVTVSSGGGGAWVGTGTSHQFWIRTNGTTALTVDTSQNVEAAQKLTVDSTLIATAHIVSLTSGGTPAVLSCGTGSSITGTDNYMIITPGTGTSSGACAYNFAHPYTNVPACTASATNVADGYVTINATHLGFIVVGSSRATGGDYAGNVAVTCGGINGI